MSQVRDIELEVAYSVNSYVTHTIFKLSGLEIVKYSDKDFKLLVDIREYGAAKLIDEKYVVLARYDENQYSSPPNMRIFGIFSDMDNAKDTMAVWAINKGLGNEMLDTCTYDWVLIDGVNV